MLIRLDKKIEMWNAYLYHATYPFHKEILKTLKSNKQGEQHESL